MPDSLLIGLSALQAHQRAMQVTSHNLANVATPGYSRQRAELSTPIPEDAQPGQVGRGVNATAVQRIYDNLLTDQLRRSGTEDGRLSQMGATLGAMESLFNEPGDAGITAAIAKVQAAFQSLANNPENHGMRAGAVSEIASFSDTLNSMADRLSTLRDDVADQLGGMADQINLLSQQISDLNSNVRRQVAVGNNPNDLLDARDRALAELGSLLNIRVKVDPRTQVAFVETNGRLMIDSDSFRRVEPGTSLDSLSLLFSDSGEALKVASGRVGALIDLHANVLPSTINQFDDIARTIAFSYNAIHATGLSPDRPQQTYLSQTIIANDQIIADLDAATQIAGNGKAGIPGVFLPGFTQADGSPRATTLSINVVDQASGIASKYLLQYDPGVSQPYTTRSLQNLVDAINTGSGGGFTLIGPDGSGVGITNLTASLVPVDGGVRLSLSAANGHSVDFSSAQDVRPSDHTRNALTWTAGSPTVDVSGRYTGTLAFASAQPWTLDVLAGGQVGSATGPTVRVTWQEDVGGSPVLRTTDVVLDQSYANGKPLIIGNGLSLKLGAGTMTAGDRVEFLVDGTGDQAHLLGALGINSLFQGTDARTLRVAAPLLADPSRLAVSQSRAVGDNSNILAILQLRNQKLFGGGSRSLDDAVSSMVAETGSRANLNTRLQNNQAVIQQTLESRRDAISGVNIDEEVGLLILQQQAYSAAARIITSAQENIRTLLGIFG